MRRLAGSLSLVIAVTVGGFSASGAEPAGGQTRPVAVVDGGAYIDVNAVGLAAMLQEKTFPLINVHIPYEGEIEGTDLLIPYDQVAANLRLPSDKGAKIVLYCRSGGMSAVAASDLVRLGYTNVWNLEGGMIAWEQAGYQLIHKSR